jgi:hypothetical protein
VKLHIDREICVRRVQKTQMNVTRALCTTYVVSQVTAYACNGGGNEALTLSYGVHQALPGLW